MHSPSEGFFGRNLEHIDCIGLPDSTRWYIKALSTANCKQMLLMLMEIIAERFYVYAKITKRPEW